MKIDLRGVVGNQKKIGEKHLIQVEVTMKGTNEDLQLGPTIPDFQLYVMCTPEQARCLPTDLVLDAELKWRLPPAPKGDSI